MKYLLSLGSNLGQKTANIATALECLKKQGVRVCKVSSFYRTQPKEAPEQPDFINIAAEIESDKQPEELLDLLKKIEKDMGRVPSPDKRPRIIDIDIILAQNRIIHRKNLHVPHLRMAERNFVLEPLREIAPEARHPVLKKTVQSLREESVDTCSVERIGKNG